MFCTFCGKAYAPPQYFCTDCGRPLPGAGSGQTPAAATPSSTSLSAAGAADSPAAPAATVPYSSVAGTPEPSYPNLTGLGGWLILVAIGLFLNLFFRLHSMVKDVGAYTSRSRHLLTDQSSAFHIAGFLPVLRFEFSAHVIFFAANACLIYLFFFKKRSFPSWYITCLWAFAVFAIIDAVFVQLGIQSASSEHFRQVMAQKILGQEERILGFFGSAIIWTLYMLRSKRVKNTFVR